MADVTREELRDLREDLVERLNTGFGGVHQRLDVLNGRTGKTEVAAAEASLRLTNVEREIFHRSRRHGGAGELRDEDRPALTRREWSLVWGLLGTIAALLTALWQVLK
jgi:hypothetical protein